MINFEELTLGELEELELLIGTGIDTAFADGKPKGRALRALYFVAMKRENPNLKFEDTANITQKDALKVFATDEKK